MSDTVGCCINNTINVVRLSQPKVCVLMNDKETRRGHVDSDKSEFSDESLIILKKAQEEIHWLIDRGYPIKNAVTFVGNHYMFSNRQRQALIRATSTTAAVVARMNKVVSSCEDQIIYIDGFNLIITLDWTRTG